MSARPNPAAPDPVRVLYVGSWSRSGSTLLDLILGQVRGFVSVGELRYLWERGLAEGQRCGCGVPVPTCPFWSAVLEEAFGRVGGVNLRAMLALWRRVDDARRLAWLVAPSRPHRFERDLEAFRAVLSTLYQAVGTVSGGSVVIDSSKYAVYGLILAGVPRLELRVLHLVRDSRAVAYSWSRRRAMPDTPGAERFMPIKRPWRSAVFWAIENAELHLLRQASHGSDLLRYDELAGDPERSLAAALAGLGIAADLGFLRDGRLALGTNHMVAGNPLRFERGVVPIRPDLEWRRRLPPGARRVVTALTWPLLLAYGYPLRARA